MPLAMLDLDLDFFLSGVAARRAPRGQRLAEPLEPWMPEQVREFLETRCRLDRKRPVRGAFLTAHHEVFKLWRDEIAGGRLSAPFDVVHVDAHADLGEDDASWPYIGGTLLHLPLSQRPDVADGRVGLHEGNFLAIALACRWISRLTYVHHRERLFHLDLGDVPRLALKNFDAGTNTLQLKKLRPGTPAAHDSFIEPQDIVDVEPEILLEIRAWETFTTARNFDRVYLTQSPRYTPETADALIPVILEYIDTET